MTLEVAGAPEFEQHGGRGARHLHEIVDRDGAGQAGNLSAVMPCGSLSNGFITGRSMIGCTGDEVGGLRDERCTPFD